MLRPPRHTPRRREVEWLKETERFEFPFEGETLTLHSIGTGPVVLLVHGWGGRGSQLGAFIAPLVELGYRVVALDLPAHGQSSGKHTNLPQASRAVRAVLDELGPVHAVIAHSFGTAATTVALSAGAEMERAVFLSGPADLFETWIQTSEQWGLSREVFRRVQERIERRLNIRFDDYVSERIAPGLEVPLLVLHDRGDHEVPIASGERLAEVWPHARLVRTEGLGHRRILRDSKVVDTAVEFVSGSRREVVPQPAAAGG